MKTGIRRNKCHSFETTGECQYGENCVYSHDTLDMRCMSCFINMTLVAATDLCRKERDLNIPDDYNGRFGSSSNSN